MSISSYYPYSYGSYQPGTVAWTYDITVPPANLPLSLALVKEHLRLDAADTSQDTYLTLLINAATEYCQNVTGLTLIDTTFQTFRDGFYSGICLERTPFSSLVSVERLVDNVWTAVSTDVYYVSDEFPYAKVLTQDNQCWPDDEDGIRQSVRATFVAGYGADDTSVPSDIKIALLNHIAALYENRGDCAEDMIPQTTKTIYGNNKIIRIDLSHGDVW